MIMVPIKYHNKKNHEAKLNAPRAKPKGIPIIRPKPITKEGAIAISGLFAREKSTINNKSPNKSKGFIIKLVRINAAGNKKEPIAGYMITRFITNKTITEEIRDIT